MAEYVLINLPDTMPRRVKRVLGKGLRRIEKIVEEEGTAPDYWNTVPILVAVTFDLYPKLGLKERAEILGRCIDFLSETAAKAKLLRSHDGRAN